MISPTTIRPKVPAAWVSENAAGRDRHDREAIENERGGVVGEAFALQHHENAPRQRQPPRDGERRHHVGRRDDGAEHEGHAPLPAEQVMQGGGDRAGGEHDAAEGEQRDRAEVEAEFAPAHRHAGRIDQRRQQHQQHQFRRELDRRQPGNERQRNARDHQQDRRRGFQALGDDRDQHQHRQQKQHDLDGCGHSASRAPKRNPHIIYF